MGNPAANPKTPPSARWTSFNGWDYGGLKERLESAVARLDKPSRLGHAELIKGQKLTMSAPFSAGQYWVCFEMVAKDSSLVIARVRLPRHPDTPAWVTVDDEAYAAACEVATMDFVRRRLPRVRVPAVYAYAAPGSQRAAQVGASYMLIEGFYGNTLQDVQFDMCRLPIPIQEHIIAQWTAVQTELAILAYSQIGSICATAETGEPTIGKLSIALSEGWKHQGPFATTAEYFAAIAESAINKSQLGTTDPGPNPPSTLPFATLGAHVLMDIIRNTDLFRTPGAPFPVNHMDLGTQSILVDDAFNFVAIIDWEFAHTAPWQVNHFPMPFPRTWPEAKIEEILADPEHVAHKNISRQDVAQKMYVRKFRDAEKEVCEGGRPLAWSVADELEGAASRIFACFSQLGRMPSSDEDLVGEMVRLAFRFSGEETHQYLQRLREMAGGGE